MSVAAAVVLVLAGLSESAGRIAPLVARRHRASRASVVRLLLAGTVIQASVFAAWPLVAWAVADLALLLVEGHPVPGPGPTWSAASAIPLLFCAVFAFPLLGPALHVVVLVLAGLALTDHLVAVGSGWGPAAASVAVAGVVLALVLSGIRRGVGAWGAVRVPPEVTP